MVANNISELLQGIVAELRTIARSETVVGNPVTVGDRTVIPITKISVGFGVGGGEGSQNDKGSGFGGGGGGGVLVEPAVFLVLEPGKVSVIPARKEGALGSILQAAPEVFDAIKKWASNKSSDSSDSKNSAPASDESEKTD
jgi:uncharacterized spore protein YtfJ